MKPEQEKAVRNILEAAKLVTEHIPEDEHSLMNNLYQSTVALERVLSEPEDKLSELPFADLRQLAEEIRPHALEQGSDLYYSVRKKINDRINQLSQKP